MAVASLQCLQWNPLIRPTQKRSLFFNHTVSTRFLRVSAFQTIKGADASKKKTMNGTEIGHPQDAVFSFKPFNGGPPLIFKSPSHSTQPVIRALPFNSAWLRLVMYQALKPQALKDRKTLKVILDALFKTLKSLQKPATLAILLGVLLTFNPHSALAASAGRMGGWASSSSSSSSGNESYSSSSSPSLSSSRSYSSSSSPWTSSSSCYSSSSDNKSHWTTSSPGFWELLFLVLTFVMLITVVIFALFLVLVSNNESYSTTSTPSYRSHDGATKKTSVLKLQVGLLGSARSLQRDLDRIASSADTSTKKGLNYVLTETAVALLRHPNYCISAYSSTDVKCSKEDVENLFNRLSMEERGKCDEETLVNFNNMKKKSTSGLRSKGFSNEYIVVTILVAAKGVHKLPVINGSLDLKEALQKLGSVSSGKTLAVEVLWTPQLENDVLCKQELLEDYPLLRPLEG